MVSTEMSVIEVKPSWMTSEKLNSKRWYEKIFCGKRVLPVSDEVTAQQEVKKVDTNVQREFNFIALNITDLSVKDDKIDIDLGGWGKVHMHEKKMIHSAAKIMMAMLFSLGFTFNKDNASKYKAAISREANSKQVVQALTKYCIENALRKRLSKQYKKYMVSEENAIQAFGLALEEIATENELPTRRRLIKPEPGKTFLGCKFDDKDYTYSTTDGSRWGEHPLPPMIFKTEEEFQVFLKTLSDVCSSIVNDRNLNNLDQLIRFISEFKGQTRSLEEFYKSYKYPFRPFEDTAGFQLQLLTELSKKKIDVKNHFYLISIVKDVPKFRISDNVNEEASVEEYLEVVNSEDFLGDVAGAIQIVVNDIKGYIIIDFSLNHGLNVPIVIMEDGEGPHTASLMVGNDCLIFELVNVENKPSIIVYKETFQNKRTYKSKYFIYYDVGSPFCDFLQSSYKRNLLNYAHGIFSLRENGSRIYHWMNIDGFQMKSKSTGIEKSKIVWEEKFLNMDKTTTEFMDMVAQDLNTSRHVLYGKMLAVKMLISNDDQLLEALKSLKMLINNKS